MMRALSKCVELITENKLNVLKQAVEGLTPHEI